MSDRMKIIKAYSDRMIEINKMPEGENKKEANAELVLAMMDSSVDLVNEPISNPNFIFLSNGKPIEL